uniref:Uncharacterized protein n=1 Tax=Anguilla anguilla TaxID=7936 RepID=A0A0E9PV08_ANGAN
MRYSSCLYLSHTVELNSRE